MGRRAVDLSAIGSKSRRATLLNYTRHFFKLQMRWRHDSAFRETCSVGGAALKTVDRFVIRSPTPRISKSMGYLPHCNFR